MDDNKTVQDGINKKINDNSTQLDEISSEHEDQSEEENIDENLIKDDSYYYGLFEAILFLSNEPVLISFFVKNYNLEPTKVKIILDSLIDDYEERSGGILLKEILNGYQFVTNN